MKKLFLFFVLVCTVSVHASYNYHWAVEQKYTTRSSVNQIAYLNTLIAGLRSDGNWTKLDVIYFFATETQQQAPFNLKSPGTNTCTEVASITWTAKQGYTGNGVDMLLNTNFNPNTQGVNYLQNDACFGAYSRTAAEFAGDIEVGIVMGGNYTAILQMRRPTNVASYAVNNGGTIPTVTNTDGSGFFLATRTSSTTIFLYRNGSQISTGTYTSATMGDGTVSVFARRVSGTTFDSYSERQISVVLFGSGTVGQANLNTRVEAIMDSVGSGVQ